ncbi:MAG: hypothetical protein LBM98_00940 [Oscillospiraceae bacterium]|jgi:hypothetical protein|nr:hypothetical protein [Oscillospiraceae bacterium]
MTEEYISPHGHTFDEFLETHMTPDEITLLNRQVDYIDRRLAPLREWRNQRDEPIYQPIPAPYIPQPISREN